MQNKLIQLLNLANITLTAEQQHQLLLYLNLLERWNKTYNLTAVRNADEMLIRHIMDSLAIIPWLTGKYFIDVGSGAGLPGVPLAISLPDCHFTLLDSLGKRTRFLQQVQHQLKLTNLSVVHSRVEQYTTKQHFDGIISRAFASLTDMVNWCGHLANETSRFYAMKGQHPGEEIRLLPDNMVPEQLIRVNVAGLNAERHLVVIRQKMA